MAVRVTLPFLTALFCCFIQKCEGECHVCCRFLLPSCSVFKQTSAAFALTLLLLLRKSPPLSICETVKTLSLVCLVPWSFSKDPCVFQTAELKINQTLHSSYFFPPPYSFGGRFCTSLWYEGEMLCSLTSF